MERRLIKEALDENGFCFICSSTWYETAYNRKLKLRRLYDDKGYASFYCSSCRRDWSSYNSWITIDVQNPAIVKKFNQLCKSCNKRRQPHFTDDEIRRMVKHVVEKIRTKPDFDNWRPTPMLKAPHDNERCEKCNYGRGPLCSSLKRSLYSNL